MGSYDGRHSYATAGRDVKIDWKALSKRIGHADVAFTMKPSGQTALRIVAGRSRLATGAVRWRMRAPSSPPDDEEDAIRTTKGIPMTGQPTRLSWDVYVAPPAPAVHDDLPAATGGDPDFPIVRQCPSQPVTSELGMK
jgi:hypothetical protein